MDTEKHREQVRARNRAWYRAARELIKAHPEEFTEIFVREADKEGVRPQRGRKP